MKSIASHLLWIVLSMGLSVHASAEVRMPAIFGDHMVLQGNVVLPVWGTAGPGEKIEVTIAGRQAHAVADSSGKWMVKLDPLTINHEPVEVRVAGVNTLTFHDVLIGDVWLCSGQSNMEFGLGRAQDGDEAIRQANRPQLRLFTVQRNMAFTPQDECKGEWLVCTPDNVKKNGWGGFSAVGYFFGSEVQQARQIPVGLIHVSWGGTPAQAWTALETLQASPELTHYAASFLKIRDTLPQLKTVYETQTLPAWQQADRTWQEQYGAPFKQAEAQWHTQADIAAKTGLPAPPRPAPEKPEPKKPVFAGEDPYQPTVLFNGMLHPLLRYGIKGVVWYQGEGNANSKESCAEYATLFPAMIPNWRQSWSAENSALAHFPFLYVQLASWGPGWAYPLLRESQAKALALPNTGMAVAIDVGEENDIHPRDKADVGHRLALQARRIAYGENIVASGPEYDSCQTEGHRLRLRFRQTGGGLVIGTPAHLRPAAGTPGTLAGFAVAGKDGKFVPAKAEISGDAVLVWSDEVPQPLTVRYAWTPFPKPAANLYNREGLPAVPFDTGTAGR